MHGRVCTTAGARVGDPKEDRGARVGDLNQDRGSELGIIVDVLQLKVAVFSSSLLGNEPFLDL